MKNNKITLKFLSISENESLARNVVACFALKLNPSIAQITDIKTAVSEAVTNSIVHGYDNTLGEITIEAEIIDNNLHINVIDYGKGIDNVEDAIKPFFTTKPEEERSGMGFTIMKSFMDNVEIKTKKGCGTTVYMSKIISQ